MTQTLLALMMLVLSGCAAIGNLPTMEYCSDVSYVRSGNQIDIKAHCAAPIKDSSALNAIVAPLSK